MSSPLHNFTPAHSSLADASRRWLAVLLASFALMLPSLTLGAALTSLNVEFEGDAQNAAAIREAISRELSVPVEGSGPTLHLVVDGESATMTFVDPEKGPVERTIELPKLEQERIEVLALLAGNLVRDQSFDLTPRGTAAAAPLPVHETAASATAGATAAKEAEDETTDEDNAAEETPTQPENTRNEAKTASSASESSEDKPLEDRQPVEEGGEDETDEDLSPYPFNLALVSPVEVMPGAAERRIAVQVGLLFGRIGASSGLRIEGLVGVSRFAAHGFGVGGLWLDAGSDSKGMSIAGLVTRATNNQAGLHLSGIAALAGGRMHGLQLSGIATRAGGPIRGLQVGGILTHADEVRGMQLGGILTHAGKVRGLQLGVVNIGGPVNGVQLGVVNIAREVKGAQIGLVNVASNSRYQAVSWFDEQTTLHAGGRVMSGPLFGMLAFGVNPQGFSQQGVEGDGAGHYPLALSYGFGGRMTAPALPRWLLEIDLVYTSGLTTNSSGFTEQALRQRASIGFELNDAVTLIAGAGVKQRWQSNQETGFKLGPTLFAGVQLW